MGTKQSRKFYAERETMETIMQDQVLIQKEIYANIGKKNSIICLISFLASFF